MREVPLTNSPKQRLVFEMEGEDIVITVRYRTLTAVWDFALERAGVVILAGQRILLGTELLRAHNFRLGALFAVDRSESDRDATREDLGSRVVLVHASEAELAGSA